MEFTDKTAMLAKQPTGREDLTDWVIQPKYDGWRILAEIEPERVRLFGRSGAEYSGHTPKIDWSLLNLPAGTVVDGEMVHPRGWRFVQEILGSEDRVSEELEFVLFDILQLSGDDLRELPLKKRSWLLRQVMKGVPLDSPVTLAPTSVYTPEGVVEITKVTGEGVIAKDPESKYSGGVRSSWIKFKAVWTEDVVITGGIAGKGEIEGQIGSLTIGQYDEDGRLVPLGNTWGKFSHEERWELTKLWLAGELVGRVAEITVQGFTNKGKFRSPVIQRWREDKRAQDCVYTPKEGIYQL